MATESYAYSRKTNEDKQKIWREQARKDETMEELRRRIEQRINPYRIEVEARAARTIANLPALMVNISQKYHRGDFDGLTYASIEAGMVETIEAFGFTFDGIMVLKRAGRAYPVLTLSFKMVFEDLKAMGDYLEQFITNDGRSE